MSNRILVNVTASESEIGFRTVAKKQKSPHRFYIMRSEWERLCLDGRLISNDEQSFAKFWYERDAGVLSIRFSWVSLSGSEKLTGWGQTVRLPYDALAEFISRSRTTEEPKQWKTLSLEERGRPKLVFCSMEHLHAALSNKTVRRRLVRFLRDNFNWRGEDRICFYNDFLPYSFFFQAFRGDRRGICGGLILHDHQDLSRAHYSIHT